MHNTLWTPSMWAMLYSPFLVFVSPALCPSIIMKVDDSPPGRFHAPHWWVATGCLDKRRGCDRARVKNLKQNVYTCGLKLGMCAPGGALFRPKNESTTWNACTPQVLLFFWKFEFFWYRWHAFFGNPLTVWDTWNACTWNAWHLQVTCG